MEVRRGNQRVGKKCVIKLKQFELTNETIEKTAYTDEVKQITSKVPGTINKMQRNNK